MQLKIDFVGLFMKMQASWPGHYIAGSWAQPTQGTKWTSYNPSTGAALLEVYSTKQNTEDAITCADNFYRREQAPKWSDRVDMIARLEKALEEYRTEIEVAYRTEVGNPLGKPLWRSVPVLTI